MASAVHSLRLSLRAAVGRAVAPTPARPRQLFALRRFSSSPFQRLPAVKKGDVEVLNGEEELDRDDDSLGLGVDVEDMDAFEDAVEAHEWQFDELDEQITESERMPKNTSNSLYFEDDEEEDPDATHSGMKAHEFDDDDMMTIAHGKLDELREYREYARIAAWQMPLLSSKTHGPQPPTSRLAVTQILKNSPLPSNHRRPNNLCDSDTQATWENSTLPKRKSWSSSPQGTCH